MESKERIKVVKMAQNGGVAKALNTGLNIILK
jgi:hypothetical protein